jgi:hypothetical protein
MASTFSPELADALVTAVGQGLTLTEACARYGVSYNSARNWVTAGNRDPLGRYGDFTRQLDAARQHPVGGDDDPPGLGPVAASLATLLDGRELDAQQRVLGAQCRTLAATIDRLGGEKGGNAAAAIATASRRLSELLDDLEIEVEDDLDRLVAARAHRLANPDTDRSGSSPGVHHVGQGS